MHQLLIVISSVLALLSTLPYVRDIIKRHTKPRIVSWFTWTLLGAISSAASLSDHQYAAAILSFCTVLSCGTILVLAWVYNGEKSISRFDIACQIAALAGLVLWYIFNSPAIAIIAAIAVDLVGSLPTLRHSWQQPYEETAAAYAIYVVASVLTILAVTSFRVTSIANPIYYLTLNIVFVSILIGRRNSFTKKAVV